MPKTKVTLPKPEETNPRFPLLARLKATETIVLFKSEREGFVWGEASKGRRLGAFSETWTPCHDTDTWQILPEGTIIETII